ncbi:unnamed protein product [Ectocarpus sp. 4 AP-2014]
MFSFFNFVGAYLWYHMRDAVQWLPVDPHDMQPDNWRPDLRKYSWVCPTSELHAPQDQDGLEQYIADYRMVRTISQCRIVIAHWGKSHMRTPNTRTRIDMTSKEWGKSI